MNEHEEVQTNVEGSHLAAREAAYAARRQGVVGVLGVGRNAIPSRITIMDTGSIRLSDGLVPNSMDR